MNDAPQCSSDQPQKTEPRRAARDAALGFGFASLYGLPSKRERRAVLDAAYELGIRHFDVAPMYGLGFAETELAEFMGNRADIRVATKFGIRPTFVGRFAGWAQSPIRRALQSTPAMKAKTRSLSSKRDVGILGRVLYSDRNYSVANARRSLMSSLRTLRADQIDYFFLHEPAGAPLDQSRDLVEFLESARRNGLVGNWGPAGELSDMDDNLRWLSAHATVLQLPYDLFNGYCGPAPARDRATITFGIIGTALQRLQEFFAREPNFRRQCSELLDADLADERTVIRLLVRNAVTQNQSGTVLVSSTKIGNLTMLCEAADAPLRNETQVARMIRQQCHTALP